MFRFLLTKKQVCLLVLVVIFAMAVVGGFTTLGTAPNCFNVYTWGDFAAEIGFLAVIAYLSYSVGRESERHSDGYQVRQ